MNKLIENGGEIFSPTQGDKETQIASTLFRRKIIYKGKMAPKGTVFIELQVRTERMKYTKVEHIPGGQTKELEAIIEKQMLEQICKTYNLWLGENQKTNKA